MSNVTPDGSVSLTLRISEWNAVLSCIRSHVENCGLPVSECSTCRTMQRQVLNIMKLAFADQESQEQRK